MRASPIILSVVAVSASVIAQPARPPATSPTRAPSFDRARYAIPYETFALANGLTVIVHEDHAVPIVGVNLWYHVGSRNERRGRTGFAHLFEHFFFNGSEHYPHGFREAMDDLGANNRNGTTSTDRTNFFEDVPVSALERTLYLEADRMGFLAANISEAMLERERGVVQNEKRQGENQPYGSVFTRIAETMYPPSHPYSWSTIGSMDDLNAARLNDVKEWYSTYYGPNNCVLVLSGDITVSQARALSKKYFEGIPPGPPLARAESWIPRLDRNIRDRMEDRVPQARIYRVYHAPAWGERDAPLLGLLAGALSGSRSARLDRRLVYETGLATSVAAGMVWRELAGLLNVVITVKPGADPTAAEREMDAVIEQLLRDGPTLPELQRAQSRVLADFVRGTERLGAFGGRADVLAESMTFGGRADAYLDRLQATATASPDDVKAAGQAWLRANHYTLLVSPYPKLAPGATTVDRSVLPGLGAPPDVGFPKVQRATLSNGLSVMLLERHGAPLVNLALAVDAGHSADPPAKAGAASLALDLMDDGTATRDTFAIADELDALGARLSTGSTLDRSLVRLQALSANLRPSLDIFADVVLHPAFPQDIVALEKRRRLARIAQEKADPVSAAMRIVPGLLYGEGHAYGSPVSGSGFEQTVESLTRDELVWWHQAWFHPGNATLVATGDTTLAQLVPELERVFGAWKPGEPPKKRLDAGAASAGGRVYLLDKPDAPQSVIIAAHVSEPGGQAEDLAIETVMRNFGGMSTSRLNRNLRLDKHWSYGVSGQLVGARGPRPLLVIAPVQADKTKESMVEIAKELKGVAGDRPLAGEEFASIMRNQTMSLPGRFETLASLEASALQLLDYKYPDDYFANYAGRVRALKEADLAAAAKKFVRPDRIIWIVVGDLAKVEAGIREIGFGPVLRVP